MTAAPMPGNGPGDENTMPPMRIYVTHDDGAEAEYDVIDVRVTTPVSVEVEYSQLVLRAIEDTANAS